MSTHPDAVLMERLREGEDTALNKIMERWQTPLTSYLYRYTGNHADALDLAQETFVRVYENRLRYESRKMFSTWLFTIATNLCRNHARWRKRHATVSLHAPGDGSEDGEPLDARLENQGLTPAAAAERQDVVRAVRQGVQNLPHELRTPLLLSEYEQLSHAEIAGVLGCTAKAVETRLYRARERLRKALAGWRTA